MTHKITIHTLEQLNDAAREVLDLLDDKKVIAFYGHMGAGKTTFIKALCKELGVQDNVSSPTFALVNEYNTSQGKKVFHFDFYRIKSIQEAYDMGYEDYLYSGNYCLIEWPEKIEELLPENVVKIHIQAEADNSRLLLISE
jgi:tRNA threonylcarbamoyladenosine biosynthesis protein TsaE